MNNDKLILFDGVCNLCNGGVQFIIKKDRKAIFKFTSLQSPTGQSVLQKFNLPASDFNSFVYVKNGSYMLKSTAVLHILKDLGNGWQLFYGFIIIPRFIRDGIYSLIAKNRYKLFGRRETCMIPTPDISSRFID